MTNERTALDLFSGLGGFALACQANGVETVAFCEADTRCREFLERTWSRPVHPDIRTLDATAYRGAWLVTGGPPCQPASRAGNQGGAEDDRWLWDQAIRVVKEARPDWFLFENPPGILDVGLDGILDELEALGYEVAPPFDIPACAVDSPQLRHRLWIVGHAKGRGFGTDRSAPGSSGHVDQSGEDCSMGESGESDVADHSEHGIGRQRQEERRPSERDADQRDYQEHVADTDSGRRPKGEAAKHADGEQPITGVSNQHMADTERERRQRRPTEPAEAQGRQSLGPTAGLHWSNSVWVPCADGKLRRAPDESLDVVNGLHRSILGALGNSIVWQVPAQIIAAMIQAENE